MQYIYIKWNFENNKLFGALLRSIETTTLVEALPSLYQLSYLIGLHLIQCRILPIVSLSFETLTKKEKKIYFCLFNRKKESVSVRKIISISTENRERQEDCVCFIQCSTTTTYSSTFRLLVKIKTT